VCHLGLTSEKLAEVIFGEFAVTYGEIYYGAEEFGWKVCRVVHFALWVLSFASSGPVCVAGGNRGVRLNILSEYELLESRLSQMSLKQYTRGSRNELLI
jgi:hypothetical protein